MSVGNALTGGTTCLSSSSQFPWLYPSPDSKEPWQRGLTIDAEVTDNERAWAFGIALNFNGTGYNAQARKGGAEWGDAGVFRMPPLQSVTRSDKMMVQSQLEATGRALNEQIDCVLKASGISLGEKERLNFKVDQTGKICITGGISDSDGRKQVLEDLLNGDDAIRSNLFLYQVQKKMVESKNVWESGSLGRGFMLARAYDWAHGNITGVQEDDTIGKWSSCGSDDSEIHERYWRDQGFPAEFSYQDGKVFQGDTFPEDRVFSDRLDSLADLGKIIGLDESAAKDIQSFVTALEQNITVDASKLAGLLNTALGKAKLGDVTKKITFSQDAEGRIVIEGNIDAKQKQQLANIINDDPELAELIKTQSAKKAVLDELKASITDEPVFHNSYSAWRKHEARPAGFNLSQDNLASVREQLLKNFLDRNGISMSDLKSNPDAVFANHAELCEIKGLRNEISHLLTQKTTSTEPEPLLAMKRGELVEVAGADERLGIDEGVADLKQLFNDWVGYYNKIYVTGSEAEPGAGLGQMVTGYSLTLDNMGRISFEVETEDGNPVSAQRFKQFVMTHYLKPNTFQELGLAILDAHDDEHGDVLEHAHSVVIESGTANYRVESPEADQAALEEMTVLSQEIGMALGQFFGKTMSPFSVLFGEEGLLSLGKDGTLSQRDSQAIQKVLDEINHYFLADRNGEETKGMLSPELADIAEKLSELKEVQDKIHDKSLLPEKGIRFTV